MNEPFHANLKLITGEELLAEVFVTEECGEETVSYTHLRAHET